MWTSTWRVAALNEAQRLENELAFVPAGSEPAVAIVQVHEAIARARAAASTSTSIDKWCREPW